MNYYHHDFTEALAFGTHILRLNVTSAKGPQQKIAQQVNQGT